MQKRQETAFKLFPLIVFVVPNAISQPDVGYPSKQDFPPAS